MEAGCLKTRILEQNLFLHKQQDLALRIRHMNMVGKTLSRNGMPKLKLSLPTATLDMSMMYPRVMTFANNTITSTNKLAQVHHLFMAQLQRLTQ